MGARPSRSHTLDRFPNAQGHYEPGNVRWATVTEQNNNRRSNRFIDFKGERLTVADWARRLGMTYGRLISRLDRGWPLEMAMDPSSVRYRREAAPTLKSSHIGQEIQCAECGNKCVKKEARSRFCGKRCRSKATNAAFYQRNRTRITNERRQAYGSSNPRGPRPYESRGRT